jgi:sugar (pentulose or hexulose) kinase
LDVGTTAIKAAVFDEAFDVVSHGRAATPWRGSELDPDELLRAAIEAAAAALDGRTVAGIGVASMAETGVLADDDLRPVVPSIGWWDTRGEEEAERLAAELPHFSARTGLPATSMCTLAKYAWMRRHWPDAARGTRWLSVAEWIVVGLGGEARAEASLASRTGFYDLHTGRAWEPAMRWANAPPTLAPPHAPAGTPLGHVGERGHGEAGGETPRDGAAAPRGGVTTNRGPTGAPRRGARRRRRRGARGRRARPRGGGGRGGRGG